MKGVDVLTPRFFNEFAIRTPMDAEAVLAMLDERGVVGGVRASRLFPGEHLGDVILVAATECTTADDIAAYADALEFRRRLAAGDLAGGADAGRCRDRWAVD